MKNNDRFLKSHFDISFEDRKTQGCVLRSQEQFCLKKKYQSGFLKNDRIIMNFIKSIFILFSMFFMIAHAASQSASAELTQLLISIQTMQASFTQMVYDNHGKVVQESDGKMLLKRPGQFRWEVKKPIPQLVIANGSRLWIYDPDLEQVTIRLIKDTSGETPALLLSRQNIALDRDYVVKYAQKKSSSLRWFILIPKEKDSAFASIQLGFLNGNISQMQLEDQLGHTTLIRFSHIKMNNPSSNTSFVFRVPPAVDVIDETKSR